MRVASNLGTVDLATGSRLPVKEKEELLFASVYDSIELVNAYEDAQRICYEYVPLNVSVVFRKTQEGLEPEEEGERFAEKVKVEGEKRVENFLLLGVSEKGTPLCYYGERLSFSLSKGFLPLLKKGVEKLLMRGLGEDYVREQLLHFSSSFQLRREKAYEFLKDAVLTKERRRDPSVVYLPEGVERAESLVLMSFEGKYIPYAFKKGDRVFKNHSLAGALEEGSVYRKALETHITAKDVRALIELGVFLTSKGDFVRRPAELARGTVLINTSLYSMLSNEEKAKATLLFIVSNLSSLAQARLPSRELEVVREKLLKHFRGELSAQDLELIFRLASKAPEIKFEGRSLYREGPSL